MARKAQSSDVLIGKFDILATYAYCKALRDGHDNDEAKQRGMVAAIMGARSRLGIRGRSSTDTDDYPTHKAAAEKKRKTSITAALFDKQIAHKMGPFFVEVFLPAIGRLVEAGLSYDEVKRLVKIPSLWGAKLRGTDFHRRVDAFLSKR